MMQIGVFIPIIWSKPLNNVFRKPSQKHNNNYLALVSWEDDEKNDCLFDKPGSQLLYVIIQYNLQDL